MLHDLHVCRWYMISDYKYTHMLQIEYEICLASKFLLARRKIDIQLFDKHILYIWLQCLNIQILQFHSSIFIYKKIHALR